MTDSWEFAVSHAAGEYVTLIGEDDGLLLHALPEIDRILRQIDAPLLRWESVCYTWPNVQPGPRAVPNELLVPLMQVGAYHPIRQVDARPMILAAAHSRISYAQLPMIYCSAVHHDLLTRLRLRTGRVFRGQCPDVYSAFALAYLVGSYYSCAAPMGLSGQSGSSNGHAEFVLGGRSPVTEEFRRLNLAAGHGPHPRVPDLPLMAAKVADSFERAREALFADEPDLMLDRKAVVLACLEGLGDRDSAVRAQAPAAIRGAIRDEPALLAWFETAWKATAPESQPNRPLRRYGGTYLHLDAADFGVSDLLGAAALCEKLLGYRAGRSERAPRASSRGERGPKRVGAGSGESGSDIQRAAAPGRGRPSGRGVWSARRRDGAPPAAAADLQPAGQPHVRGCRSGAWSVRCRLPRRWMHARPRYRARSIIRSTPARPLLRGPSGARAGRGRQFG